MDAQIALLLGQDGLVNGAIYALMAVALVLVFSVTRIIFIPQGEFVTYGALTMVALQTGHTPLVMALLGVMALLALAVDALRHHRGLPVSWGSTLFWTLGLPGLAAVLVWGILPLAPQSLALQAAATLAIVVPLGPLLYRLAYRPLADATVLTLLIVSVAMHGLLVGLGLIFFGPEGSRLQAFTDWRADLAGMTVTGQQLMVVVGAGVLVLALRFFFERSIVGKALRATALNRVGARLMGIPTDLAGDVSFALAALIGVVAGLLVGPITTMTYDTGFLIGLKGFVAAIVGGLASYPLALVGALMVGQLESFSSFWASAYKEVLVFTLILPVLWWRSRSQNHVEDEE